jgi:hypothetical protein
LTILGNREAIIDGVGEGDVLTISGDSVEIKGITIRNSGTRLLKDMSGIKVTGDYVTITDCRIIDILHGIYIKGGNDATISNNVIVGRFDIQESDGTSLKTTISVSPGTEFTFPSRTRHRLSSIISIIFVTACTICIPIRTVSRTTCSITTSPEAP